MEEQVSDRNFVELGKQLKSSQRKLMYYKSRNQELQSRITTQDNIISKLKQESGSNLDIRKFEGQLRDKDAIILELQKQLENLERIFNDQNWSQINLVLDKKDAKIKELEASSSSVRRTDDLEQLVASRKLVDNLNSTAKNLELELMSRLKEIEQLKLEIDNKNNSFLELSKQFENYVQTRNDEPAVSKEIFDAMNQELDKLKNELKLAKSEKEQSSNMFDAIISSKDSEIETLKHVDQTNCIKILKLEKTICSKASELEDLKRQHKSEIEVKNKRIEDSSVIYSNILKQQFLTEKELIEARKAFDSKLEQTKELKKSVSELEEKNNFLIQNITGLHKRIEILEPFKTRFDDCSKEITIMKSKITELDNFNASLKSASTRHRKKIADYVKRIEVLERELQVRDYKFQELEEEKNKMLAHANVLEPKEWSQDVEKSQQIRCLERILQVRDVQLKDRENRIVKVSIEKKNLEAKVLLSAQCNERSSRELNDRHRRLVLADELISSKTLELDKQNRQFKLESNEKNSKIRQLEHDLMASQIKFGELSTNQKVLECRIAHRTRQFAN